MKLLNIQTQIIRLQLKPIIMLRQDKEHTYNLHMDAVDNFLNSLHGLPDKYITIWKEINSKKIMNEDDALKNTFINQQILATNALLSSIHEWVESLSHTINSPSFRSGQLQSIRSKELPKLLSKKKVDRIFIEEVVINFFDKIIEEFQEQSKKLSAYKNEFIEGAKIHLDNKDFKKWCKNFFERVQTYFDNHCLENEYEWHVSPLERGGAKKYKIDPPNAFKTPSGYIAPPGIVINDSPGAMVISESQDVKQSAINSTDKNSKEGNLAPWLTTIFSVLGAFLIGYLLWYFNLNGNRADLESKEKSLQQVEQSPNSVNIIGNNNTINKLDFPKPQIELESFEINTSNPNPEIGFDSVYIIKIISDYTIPNFPFKIKLPPAVDEVWLSKGWMYTKTEDYSPKYIDGYASFDIPNAGGDYYLVFSNKNEVHLSKDDIIY